MKRKLIFASALLLSAAASANCPLGYTCIPNNPSPFQSVPPQADITARAMRPLTPSWADQQGGNVVKPNPYAMPAPANPYAQQPYQYTPPQQYAPRRNPF